MASCKLADVSARVTRIDIEGFRVVDKLSLELRPLNVLIGENGSGKSTVLEAFELIRKAATMSGDQFISDLHNLHGGVRMFRGGGPGLMRRLKVGLDFDSGNDEGNGYRCFDGNEVAHSVWDMLSCVETCIAIDYDGVIIAAEGIYDSRLEPLVRF